MKGFRTLVVALLVLGGVVLAGCGFANPFSEDTKAGLRFRYDAVGKPGYIDQALTLTSERNEPVVLEGRIDALDSDGHVISDLVVTTVFGSTARRQVLMPGENLDFVQFLGSRANEVRDVRVTPLKVEPADVDSGEYQFSTTALGANGEEVAQIDLRKVRVQNGDNVAAVARVVFIVWNDPEPGSSQQAEQVIDLGPTFRVEAHGAVVLALSRYSLAQIAEYSPGHATSIKAYYSNPAMLSEQS